jgi:haloacid dehalogenase-like hydrolase
VVYAPRTRETRVLADPPSPEFAAELRRRGIADLSIGSVIVATVKPWDRTVLQVIRELGLALQVVYNHDAVMVLPAGVDKATGLLAALAEVQISRHNAVALGDAENDMALLQACECGVAVANALPALKMQAQIVTTHPNGRGVEELIQRLLASDLQDVPPRRAQHVGSLDDMQREPRVR